MIRRWILRGLLLCGVLTVLIALVSWRYHQLKTRVQITRFFREAPMLFPPMLDLSLQTTAPEIPPSIRKTTGDVLPELLRLYPTMRQRSQKDPFGPESGENRLLEVRYGIVRHSSPVQMPYSNPNRPVWFTWSAGPSGADPALISQFVDDVTPTHQFKAPPYQPSNGLWSQGYLYVDSLGGQVGKYR